MNRINFVTLGVKDLKKSKSFYKKLFGWSPVNKQPGVAFYDMGGWVFALFPKKELAHDIGIPAAGKGFGGITLAHNAREKADVAKILTKAKKCGAKIVKPAQDVFWGGHSGYFQDIDGHYWEVAWNPFMPTLADGTIKVK